MGQHYLFFSTCVKQTIDEVVPPLKHRIYNGRTMSNKTRELYQQRIRDYNSGRKVTKSDRAAWAKVLKEAGLEDYKAWVQRWVVEIEKVDNRGDSKEIYKGVKALAGTTHNSFSAQPSIKENGDMITSAEELGDLWQKFLANKFSATELEAAREEFPDLGAQGVVDQDGLTQEEFLQAVKRMKKGKATGPDGIPAEVWKHSQLAKEELYFFLRGLWQAEEVPKNFALCAFVMLYKKDSKNDCANYRALGLLNHSYKILTICLLNRLVKETSWFLSDWQSGFRPGRGCRDNVLLLRVIYDQVIPRKSKCVVTFIDFAAAFDSVSHKYIDKALGNAGASRKTRAIFRAIYQAAQGAARIRSVDGKVYISKTFDVKRGVIQGDIISPILFILALDQLVQQVDTGGEGVSVGTIRELRVLGYADDAAMAEYSADQLSERLTEFADKALSETDMKVKLSKTFSQIVQQQEAVDTATAAEIEEQEKQYKFKCSYCDEGCTQRFKTRRGMHIHRSSCNFGYNTTAKTFDVAKITAVFGKQSRAKEVIPRQASGKDTRIRRKTPGKLRKYY